MKIDESNYMVAEDAIRDILYMYRDLVTSYDGFGHNVNCGKFDPFEFIDFEIVEKSGYSVGLDPFILKDGSAISLLCGCSDYWDEQECPPTTNSETMWGKYFSKIKKLLEEEKFDFSKEIKDAVTKAFYDDDRAFRESLAIVYQKKVKAYFKELTR